MPTDIQDIRTELKEIHKEVQALREEIAKYKGFVGGVIWVCGALVAALGLLFHFLNK